MSTEIQIVWTGPERTAGTVIIGELNVGVVVGCRYSTRDKMYKTFKVKLLLEHDNLNPREVVKYDCHDRKLSECLCFLIGYHAQSQFKMRDTQSFVYPSDEFKGFYLFPDCIPY